MIEYGIFMLISFGAGYVVADMVLRYIRAQERIATALENIGQTDLSELK